jgi:hypothetical protein
MSPQIIPLKGRKICGDPAEFLPPRLFAFEPSARCRQGLSAIVGQPLRWHSFLLRTDDVIE